jgi:hypothetical protein
MTDADTITMDHVTCIETKALVKRTHHEDGRTHNINKLTPLNKGENNTSIIINIFLLAHREQCTMLEKKSTNENTLARTLHLEAILQLLLFIYFS